MTINKLQLNEEKTEGTVFSPHNKPRPCISNINVCYASIYVTNSARNIGIVLDSNLSMDKHISNLCSVSMFHLRRIATIRDHITRSACERLLHSLITSRIDYSNAVICGLPNYRLKNIQQILNIAARIVTRNP